MARLLEITAEQYDCLRELGVPVWWNAGQYSSVPTDRVLRVLMQGISTISTSQNVASLHTKFYTLEDSDAETT